MSLAVRIFTTLNFLSLAVFLMYCFSVGSWGVLIGLVLLLPCLCAAIALWAAFTNSRRTFLVASWIQSLMGLPVSGVYPAWLLVSVLSCVSLYALYYGQATQKATWAFGNFLYTWKWPIAGVLALAIGIASWQHTNGFTRIWDDAATLSANPSRLSGATVRDASLIGLQLENVTISNAVFINVDFVKVSLDNVTFDSCTFINCKMNRVETRNVTFRGGRMGSERRRERLEYEMLRPENNDSALRFEGVVFGPYMDIDVVGGTILLRNCRRDEGAKLGYPFLNGESLSVRIDNCDLPHARIYLKEKSRLYITQSVLRNAEI